MGLFDQDQEEIDPLTGLPAQPMPFPLPSAPPEAAPESPPNMGPQPSLSPDKIAMVNDAVMKKYGMGPYSEENRKKLQDAADEGPGLGGGISAALSALGAGFSGGDAGAAGARTLAGIQSQKDKALERFDAGRKEKIQDIDLKTKQEAESPDSDASKRFRATLQANFPQIAKAYGPDFENLTASDAKNVFQVAETKAKLDTSKALRESVNSRRIEGEDAKDAEKLSEALSKGWAARGGQAGVVQNKINSAEAAEKLLEQARTQPGGLDSRQIEELAESTSRLLGGGAQASARVSALVPHTLMGKARTLQEFLTNNPTGQSMQAFTDRLAETISREKELAQDQKRQYQVEALPGFDRFRKRNPELFGRIISSKGLEPEMIDEKGRYKPAPRQKTVVRKQYSKSANKTKLIYSDGSEEITDGQQ